jgi:Tol biopolymer transport system component
MSRRLRPSRPRLAAALAGAALVALTVAGNSTPAASSTGSGGYWIVLGSNRDGVDRAYSVRPDGSRLTMLLPATLGWVTAEAVSGNGRTIAYEVDGFGDPLEQLSVSRADGAGLRPLARTFGAAAVSPNGKLVAYTSGARSFRLFVIRSTGQGRRRLTSRGDAYEPDWSPNGKAVVYSDQSHSSRGEIVVQPLHGRSHVIVRGRDVTTPKWSPDGRWIAYSAPRGLALARPNGTDRHVVSRGSIYSFAWSPNGRQLAFGAGAKLFVASRKGGAPRRIRIRGALSIGSVSWSPNGRLLAVEAGRSGQGTRIWVVRADGSGPRVVAGEGSSTLVGWSRLAPAQPPAPALLPSEWALGPDTVATRTPISDLSADGGRVAFVLGWTGADCEHVAVWTPAAQALNRFRKPSTACDGGIYSVELSGSRAAWVSYSGCGNYCDVTLETATLDDPAPLAVAYDSVNANEPLEWPLRGDGDLLVFDEGERLVRLGTGAEKCEKALCTTLRRGAHSAPVESVSGGLIAVLEASAVAVVDGHGALVTVIPFAQNDVKAARLDGGHLIVARSGVLQVYDAASGAALQQRPLPAGYTLTDVDGGIAVLQHHETITLMRLEDGRSLTLAPGRGPVLADLEPVGLYYSYVTDEGGGRVVFVPRPNLLQAMGA